jgi:hypothetical protein
MVELRLLVPLLAKSFIPEIKLDNPFAESLKNLIPLGIDFRIKNLQKILNKAYNGYWSKLQETENYLSLWKKIDRDL